MRSRQRLLIALSLFVVAGVLLVIVIAASPSSSNMDQLPAPSGTLSGDQPDVAAVLAKNPMFEQYIFLSGARYFSCEGPSFDTNTLTGVAWYQYDGFLWDAQGNYITSYTVSANASNGQIVQFITFPFISMGLGTAQLPQMQYWTTYKFSASLTSISGILLYGRILAVAAIIMIIVAGILCIPSAVAYAKRKKPSPSTHTAHTQFAESLGIKE